MPAELRRLVAISAALAVCFCHGCAESPFSDDASLQRKTDVTSAAEDADVDTADRESAPRYLIIHADDAGMCRSVNRATIDALENGAVSSVSIMVPCPAFDEFAEYAREHPQYDYGIHLTLNAEFASYRWGPVSPVAEVSSLVDREGLLLRSEHQTAASARAEEVERELRAQIDKARAHGIPLSHLDTHMGTLFLRPDFLDIYLRLGEEYKLPLLLSRDDGLAERLGFDDRIVAQVRSAADQYERVGFPVLDKVLLHYSWDSVPQKKRTYLDMIRRVPVGVTEIVVHCGYADAELRGITGSYTIRDGDRQVFTDAEVRTEIDKQNIQLISWKQLSEMKSGETVPD